VQINTQRTSRNLRTILKRGKVENRRVNIKVTSNVNSSLKKMETAAQSSGKKSAGLLGRIKGLMSGIGGAASAATGGIRAMTAALISSGVGAVVVAMGSLIALMGKAISVSSGFEQALSGLKAITGATNEEMAALSGNAKELGASTAFTASQVVELQTEFSKLGFTTSEILNATEATLALAAASKTDLATAAMVAGQTLRGFGLDAAETGRVADVMAKSFTTSALDMEKFRESMKLVSPIAKTTKVTIEEASAALAVLADRGVSGSMAGTQLRKIMSDLATKTGKDFQTSLEITAEKLEAATSTADKLAIAKELVGDRAKGSLIALAENRDALVSLKLAYEQAGGAAQAMAEEQLDNLRGDLTKLSSAWEGFILGLEDGEGLLNKISRGAIQFVTASLTVLRESVQFLGVAWSVETTRMKVKGGANIDLISNSFDKLGVQIRQVAVDVKLALSDIPLLGDAFDKSALEARKSELIAQYKSLGDETSRILATKSKADADAEIGYSKYKADSELRIQQDKARAVAAIEQFEEGSASEDDEEDKELSRKKAFLDKLNKMEEDFEDKTELQKIERRRIRHLAALEELKLNETEKREAVERINEYYNNLKNFQIEEDKAKAKDAEAEKLAEFKKSEIEKIDTNQKTTSMLINNGQAVLDAAIGIAGEESKLGKMLFAIKQALALKDLIETAKNAALKAKVKAAESIADVTGGSAKALSTLNPLVIAGYAASAIGIIASIRNAFKSTKSAAAAAGASGGGSISTPNISTSSSFKSAQPSLNVIGRTDANANLVADTISQNQRTPLRAYVVSSDVSSQQSLDSKTRSTASMG
jgi:hypothetical protein